MKIASLLQRIRAIFVPPGSLRARIFRRVTRVLFLPFVKIGDNIRIRKDLALIRSSSLFDEKWYLENNPDISELKIDPARHYLLSGGFEGRDPGPQFSNDWYLNTYQDVKQIRINPLVHFLKYGILEGRSMQLDQLIEETPATQMTETEQKLRSMLRPQNSAPRQTDPATKLRGFLASKEVVELPRCSEPVVSIILLFHNRAEMSLQCLQSLADGAGTVPFEAVIVDNASTDDTSALLERVRNARIIRSTTNTGFGGGCNQAVDLAVGKYLLFLNNDTQLLPNSLQILVETLESDATIGAVGGKLIFPDGRLQEAGSLIWRDGSCLGYGRYDDPFKPEYCYVREVDFCSGALLLTPRELFLSLGKFDSRYAPAYYEDADYCLELWTRGYRVEYQPFAGVIHYEFGSSGTEKALALQREHRQIFVQKWGDHLNSFEVPDASKVIVAREHRSEAKRILFIDDRIPDYRLGSGFPRTYRMLEMLAGMGYKLTFLPLQLPTLVPDIAQTLQRLGIEVMYKKTTGDDPGQKIDFEEFVKSRPGYYDVVFVSRPLNMQETVPILKMYAPHTAVVYDAEALFALRDLKFKELIGEAISEVEKEKLIEDEVALIKDANAVITVSELEKEQFVKYSSAAVHILGHIVEPAPTPAPFEERQGILFIGSILFDPSPNGDAVRYFASQVLPLVRQKVNCEFYVVGTNRIKSIWNMESKSVHIIGKVEDLTPYYNRSRLFVVPTRFSAGIPLKLLEASAHGLPAVVTPLTAMQLGWQENRDLLVGHNPEDFARKVVNLYKKRDLFYSLRQNALERLQQEYSPEHFRKTLQHILTSVMDKTSAEKTTTFV